MISAVAVLWLVHSYIELTTGVAAERDGSLA